MIRVVFLAQLREQLGVAEVEIAFSPNKSLDDLKTQLVMLNPAWKEPLLNSRLLVAVNHAYAKGNQLVVDGDEVAFFPPVTGG